MKNKNAVFCDANAIDDVNLLMLNNTLTYPSCGASKLTSLTENEMNIVGGGLGKKGSKNGNEGMYESYVLFALAIMGIGWVLKNIFGDDDTGGTIAQTGCNMLIGDQPICRAMGPTKEKRK